MDTVKSNGRAGGIPQMKSGIEDAKSRKHKSKRAKSRVGDGSDDESRADR